MMQDAFRLSIPRRQLVLPEGGVHVWLIDPARLSLEVDFFMPVLDSQERRRAGRYRLEGPRTSFVIARGVLRYLLGAYLDMRPDHVRLALGPYGKPELVLPTGRQDLYFNLSRRGRAVAYALSRHPCIGIDIERIRSDLDTRRLSRYAFSPRTCHALDQLSEDKRHLAFYRGWSRKEALVKATGKGLSRNLSSFDVSVLPGDAAHVASSGDPDAWHLFDVETMPGYVCTVAVQSEECPSLHLKYVEPMYFSRRHCERQQEFI